MSIRPLSPRRSLLLLPLLALALTACGTLTVNKAELEKQVSDSLERSVGQKPDKITCPGDLVDPQVGSTTRCTLQANDGSSIGVTVKVTSVQDSTVRFDIKVDDSASTPPSS